MLSEQPTFAPHGMVACAHYLATQAGVQILTQGGNAIDAAIAANAVMTVVYPMTCSAGGDLFMLIWDEKTQKMYALNGSGRAPQGMTPEYFAAQGMDQVPIRGPLSINVPGAVHGWFEALERFGSLKPEQVFAPAIALAEDGMPVSAKVSRALERSAPLLTQWESSAATYLPEGRAPRPGERLRQPNLARTYRLLAREGRDAFYHGPIGRTIAEYVQRCGGVLSVEDLQKHRSDWVMPLSTSYRGYEVYEFPPNTQGMVALEMLNILEGYNLKELGYQSAAYLHLLLEAKKLAFDDRDTYISDPEFVDIPIERLLSKAYAEERRAHISMERAMPYFVGELEKEGDTMYLCTADNQGNVVSLIQSLYMGIGSGVIGGDTGVALHNRGSYFSLDPRHINYLQPGKRTMHTLMPGMVLRDGRPHMAIGTMGGDAQPQIHVQLLTAMLDFGLDAQQAISAPRWHSGRAYLETLNNVLPGQRGIDEHLDPGIAEVVAVENRFPAQAIERLQQLGHKISVGGPWDDGMGHAQAIVLHPEDQVFEGAADPRCDGLALGY
ncbi:MAG TPA: gamma-glutamyltransferase [Ktedonobacteraceae bacterium]|nr:gamma-glutamyltransferase [Ktedonobacteraceae bacterium]